MQNRKGLMKVLILALLSMTAMGCRTSQSTSSGKSDSFTNTEFLGFCRATPIECQNSCATPTLCSAKNADVGLCSGISDNGPDDIYPCYGPSTEVETAPPQDAIFLRCERTVTECSRACHGDFVARKNASRCKNSEDVVLNIACYCTKG
jgi:hypothetical protein